MNQSQAAPRGRVAAGRPFPRRPTAEAAAEPRLARVAAKVSELLDALGLDRTDPNLAGTEFRVARMYREVFAGLDTGAEPELQTFPNTEGYSDLVSLTNISFYSVCAHHLLPFFGSVHIAYVPGEELVGLSKLARAVDFFARRPQIQERLTEQIADFLDNELHPAGVIVVVQARHLCIEMRGVTKPGLLTTTTAIRGALTDTHLQRRFLVQLPRSGNPREDLAGRGAGGDATRVLSTPALIRSHGGF